MPAALGRGASRAAISKAPVATNKSGAMPRTGAQGKNNSARGVVDDNDDDSQDEDWEKVGHAHRPALYDNACPTLSRVPHRCTG